MSGLASNLLLIGIGYCIFVVIHYIKVKLCEWERWKENHF